MDNNMNMNEMRSILASTIRGVKTKHIKPDQARAVYSGTGQLMTSYRLELQYRKYNGEKMPTNNLFLSAPKKKK